MKDELLIDTTLIKPEDWQTFEKFELKQYVLWEHPETGASIALLDFPKGSGIPEKHSHASNQFMYCFEGHYEYTDSKLELKPGSFYGNPKDNPHGPTIAHERSILLEFYDGPHYYEMPNYHTDSTIGKITGDQSNQNTYLVLAKTNSPSIEENTAEHQAHKQFLSTINGDEYGYSSILSADNEAQGEGVTYLVKANSTSEAESIVKKDPLHHIYTDLKIQRLK